MAKIKDILNKDTWIKGILATDSLRKEVCPGDDKATHWDLVGAVMHTFAKSPDADVGDDTPLRRAYIRLAKHVPEVAKAHTPMYEVPLESLADILGQFNDAPDTQYRDISLLIDQAYSHPAWETCEGCNP